MSPFARLCLSLAATLVPGALSAQTSPFLGTWNIRYPVSMRVENGVPTAVLGRGTLVVTEHGDSLIAVITPLEGDFAGQSTRHAAARSTATTVAFTSVQPMRRADDNGGASSVPNLSVKDTWTLSIEGTALRGTIHRELIGLPMTIPDGAVTGERAPARAPSAFAVLTSAPAVPCTR